MTKYKKFYSSFVIRHSSFKNGFSIVELLVVISIIALLASVAFVQIEKARSKTRDAQREKNIKTLQDALTIYVTGAQVFPLGENVALSGTDAVSQALIDRDAISKMPQDPANTGNYRYIYNSADGSTYTLTYYLETDTIPGKNIGVNTAGP